MKVLLVFPQQDRQTGLFIHRAFKQLGCQVELVDAKLEPHNMLPKTKSFNPNLIFCSRTIELLDQMKEIRKSFPNIITICWNVDKRNSVKEFGDKLLNLFDSCHIFYTIALGNIEEYRKMCPNTKVMHLQQGCDPQTHKIEKLTTADHTAYDCEAMFAGWISKRTGRPPLFQYLSEHTNLKLYGKETKNLITDSAHNKACLCSNIVLGHNSWPSVAISMSVRDYKVMAAGGFLLTEYCPGMETWFKLGEECESYTTKEEALDKIKYYLSNEDKRKKMAESGYTAAHAKHKYADRIKQVLEDIRGYKCI